ncbi:MAG: cobalamin-dependent protein [Ignavibacteriaceae bacterium]|jgi:methanogenic corrinoid protein MtbC1|nr:cobalamin-dependent protein [Ignavibacteriaceae bacterium]
MDNLYNSTAVKIKAMRSTLPDLLLEKHFELQPSLKEKYSERQTALYKEDTAYHLSYLSEAISANEPLLFNEYLSWAKSFFANLPVTDEEIILNLELLRDEAASKLSDGEINILKSFVNKGIEHYKTFDPEIPSFIDDKKPLASIAKSYLDHLIKGDKNPAQESILNCVKNSVPIKDIYLHVFQVTQRETGRLWQINRLSVAQEHYITAATQFIMSRLYPYLFSSTQKKQKIIISCTAGELHELGARMVADFFEMDGWDSYYFGANTPPASLINAIQTYKPAVVALSVTMTFNLSSLTELISEIRRNPVLNEIKIIVGGFPFLISPNLWQHVGADGCASDALAAINLASQLTNTNK